MGVLGHYACVCVCGMSVCLLGYKILCDMHLSWECYVGRPCVYM